MLRWNPKDRASARDLLHHPWLKEADDYNVWMSKSHLKEFKLVNKHLFKNSSPVQLKNDDNSQEIDRREKPENQEVSDEEENKSEEDIENESDDESSPYESG